MLQHPLSRNGFTVTSRDVPFIQTIRAAYRRELPARYGADFSRFSERLAAALTPNQAILDVGAGAWPTVPVDERPAGCRYVGLDPSRTELEKAAPGSYDEIVVRGAEQRLPELQRNFDLLLSVFTMEHVQSLPAVLANCRSYLKPDGLLLMQLAGALSPFALANRALPARFSQILLAHLFGREPETVFKAHYDRCWHGALRKLLADWPESEVMALHVGAAYVLFSPPLTALYTAYEEWAYRRRHDNLATYYLVVARA
jgi:SAM-dependent methyltransferase